MQQQKSWLVYWFVLLMFTLSSCGGGGSGGSGGTNSPANDPTNPQHDKITISLDSSNGGVSNGETNVSLTPTLALAFSKPMQPETINPNTVILSSSLNTKDGQAVAITSLTPNADNTVFTFSPAESLQQNTKYYVSVTQDAKSADGAELDFSTQLSFSTGTIVVPTVSMLNPANNAHDVSRTPTIQLKFSESVNGVTTAHVTLYANSENGKAVAISNIATNDNIAYSFTPVKALDQLTTYYLVVGNGITDNAGSQLSNTTFSFTTASTVAPTVSMLNPANNAHDVSRTPTIQLKFSESVNGVTTDNVSLHENSESGTPVKIGKITSEKDNTYSFSPVDKLKPLTAYYVVVSSKITDELGTALNPTKFNFTTADVVVPTVSMISPANNATIVTKLPDLIIQFNESVNDVETNVSLHIGSESGTTVPISSITPGDNNTYSFYPTKDLESSTAYYVVVGAGITDNDGAKLKPTNFSFATAVFQYAYVASEKTLSLNKCNINPDGSISACASAGHELPYATGIVFNDGYAYLAYGFSVSKCEIYDGTLANCASTGSNFSAPEGIAFNGAYAYVTSANNDYLTKCDLDQTDGSLSNCVNTGRVGGRTRNIIFNGNYVYATSYYDNAVEICSIDSSNGDLTDCHSASFPSPEGIAFNGSYVYITTTQDGVYKCTVDKGNGNLSNCVTTFSSSSLLADIAFNGGYAYLTDSSDNKVLKYNVESDGSLTNSVDTGSGLSSPWGIAFTSI